MAVVKSCLIWHRKRGDIRISWTLQIDSLSIRRGISELLIELIQKDHTHEHQKCDLKWSNLPYSIYVLLVEDTMCKDAFAYLIICQR